MKTEQLMEIVKGFEEMSKSIKSGETQPSYFKEELASMSKQIGEAVILATKLFKGEEVPGMSEIQRATLIAQIEQEKLGFNYKEHKALIVSILEIVDALDMEIGIELFLPFVLEILTKTLPLVELTHEEGAKSTRKGLKKFKKKREARILDSSEVV